jgi:5-methyltetrahydrofolate--homocysteine methyltransferase
LRRPILLDGGLATTLQAEGLAAFTPVNDWVLQRPEAIARVHAAFAEAGAEILLAGTFRALAHLDPRAAEVASAAMRIARASGVPVWASIGPASTDELTAREAWRRLAESCAALGAEGLALETFIEPDECVAAVRSIRGVLPQIPLCASLVPRSDGRLFSGEEPHAALLALFDAGASIVGFNCADTNAITAALEQCPSIPAPLWLKPSRGGSSEAEFMVAIGQLAGPCAFLGGCCGVSPKDLRAMAVAIRGSGS